MPIETHKEDGGVITVFHLTGKLSPSDYASLASGFERAYSAHGKLRLLLDMTGFEGWENEKTWDEIKLDLKHTDQIDRLAAIGEKKWEHALVDFSRPFTKATVRYFDFSEATAAREWLTEQLADRTG